jgi:tetratricopeptide (TPR) repeat protein
MPYDLFISYSHSDNLEGRITELKVQIETDYRAFKPSRDLFCFFDTEDIKGMDDWRHRILQGLRESSMLLLVLSPSYLSSPYCEWEIIEYLKYEHSRAVGGQGVAPVYFVEVPGLDTPGFEQQAAAWVTYVRRRNHFDLRPWREEGTAALKHIDVRARLNDLEQALHKRITKIAGIAAAPGNLPMHNPYFVGREIEMQKLHESVRYGSLGVLTAVQGLGGLGKTSLAIQYAYAYADFYSGGRWFLKCAGETSINSVICKLDVDLDITFNEEQKHDDERAANRIIKELEKRAHIGAEKHSDEKKPSLPCTLLILDNVDFPELLQPPQTDIISDKSWLHVLATTRLGNDDIGYDINRHSFLAIDELPVGDAVRLIERHQPNEIFPNQSERNSAIEIARLLNGFTLAIEVVAVYLSERRGKITCAALLERLRNEGFAGYENISKETRRSISYRQKLLSATLGPTLDLLSPAESLVIEYAAIIAPDNIPLKWLRILCTKDYPDFEKDPGPGYDDPWINTVNHLIGMRLLQVTNVYDSEAFPLSVRMHRVLGQMVCIRVQENFLNSDKMKLSVSNLMLQLAVEFIIKPVDISLLWELDCLYNNIKLWLTSNEKYVQRAATKCCSALCNYGRYRFALELAEDVIKSLKNKLIESNVSIVWCHNIAGVAALHLDDTELAESHFLSAKEINDLSKTDDLDHLDTINNLGCLYRETFRPELAIRLLKEALEISEKKFGKNATQVGLQCINLGLALEDLCNLKEAIPLFERAVRINQTHPEFILNACQDNATLSVALRNAGRLREAEVKAKEALTLVEAYGYEQHPIASIIKNNYAKVLEAKKSFDDARELLESAFETTKLCFDQNSPHKAFCLNNLGINSLCSGNYDRSIIELQESLEIESSQSKPNYHRLSHRELNLGAAYLISKDIEQSLIHLKAGWNYNFKFDRPDLITARLLLTRIAVSFFTGESKGLYVGQLITLLDIKSLTASSIDIKWSLEDILNNLVGNCTSDERQIWRLLNNAVNCKVQGDSIVDIKYFSSFTKSSLETEWS